MAKAGYLPDISSSFSFWREYAVNCLERKNWKGAESGLHNINSILDKEYVIKVNTREFNIMIQNNTFWKCVTCGEKTPQVQIKVFHMLVPTIERVLSRQQTESVWYCPKCKDSNLQEETHKIIEEVDQPTYRKIVPSSPVQKIGLDNRFVFEFEFNKWFYNFLEELQHQLGLYRVEYVTQHGHDMVDSGYVDKGDES